LFWVGCAGAYEDRAKKTTRAVAELLDLAGVNFAVLGNGETCTGDSARRAGNEFVFQGLATQNVETFKERKVKKVVSTCAHCFNTLKNEYQEFGIELEVVHHTQLLNRLVREKKLTPVATVGGPGAQPPVSRTERQRRVTYHDPCYLGRHNQVYSPPRELLAVIPDADFVEMPRNSERSFCCGAGGARMWMEETIGTRINTTRTKEAVETGADQIAVGCPFCRVMLSDGLTEQQSKGEAREEVEVLDVAQMLLASIKGEAPARRAGDKKPEEKAPAKTAAKSGEKSVPSGSAVTATQVETAQDEATKAEPDADDTTQTEETVTAPADVGPAAKASGGSSLFDLGDDADEEAPPADEPAAVEKAETEDKAGETEDDAPAEPEEPAAARTPAGTETTSAPADSIPEGGSLFDIEAPADEPAAKPTDISDGSAETKNEAPESEEQPAAAKTPATSGATSTPADSIPEGGSLFDIEAPAEEPAAEPAPAPPNDETPADAPEDTAGDSTTDGVTDRSEDDADTDVEPTDAGSTDGTSSEPEPESGEDGASSEAPQVRSSPDGAIPGTSMFDLEARTEEPASSDANASDDSAGGHPAPEDPTGDSTTDGDTDRAEDAVDTGADRTESAKDEPRDEAEGKPEIRSLRDIKAQYAGNETPSEAPGEVSAEDSPAKTEPEAEDDSADEANTAPKPAASGDAHTPRTDAKIDESSSLFDL
ncbi:MAG: heterodisulfide reductase-related iron-sulfur binding cluster, partial [Marmoricola sp.]